MSTLFYIEITDTFAGEANYSWVTRHIIKAKSVRGAMARLSRISGINWHCKDRYFDQCRYDSKSGATCAFIQVYDADYHRYNFNTDDRE